MKHARRPARRIQAITLIELLVVIGIIAILAALLFPVLGPSFQSDAKTLASTEQDGTIRLQNLATREFSLTLKGHVGQVSVGRSFSHDGKYLPACGEDGVVGLWEAATFQEIDAKGKAR